MISSQGKAQLRVGKKAFWRIALAITILFVISPFVSPRIGSSLTATDLLAVPAGIMMIGMLPYVRRVIGDHATMAVGAFFFYGLILSVMTRGVLGIKLLTVVSFQVRAIEAVVFYGLVAAMTALRPRAMERAVLIGIYAIGLYAIFQIVTGHFTGFYRFIGLPGESGPPQSGQLYGMSCLFFIYLSNARPQHRFFYLSLFMLYLAFTIGTISRASIGGMAAAIVLFPILLAIPQSKKFYARNIKLMGYGSLVVPAAFAFLATLHLSKLVNLVSVAINRFSRVEEAGGERASLLTNNWALQLSTSKLSILSGLGLGSWQDLFGIQTLAFHSQYLRLVFEVGVIGLLLWLWTFFAIYRRFAVLNRAYLFFALVISVPMFVMGFTHEVFYVGKPEAVFYLMMGFFTGLAYRSRKKQLSIVRVVEPVRGPFVRLSNFARFALTRH